MWSSLANYRDVALLLFRVVFGAFFIVIHGWPKLAGGVKAWTKLGYAGKYVMLDFAPAVWGFLAAFSESIGLLFFIVGWMFRPSCALLIATMCVAACKELSEANNTSLGWSEASHSIEVAMVLALLFFVGPGRFSVDDRNR